jgi:hypothetical protein
MANNKEKKMNDTVKQDATYTLGNISYSVLPSGSITALFESLNTSDGLAYQKVTLTGNAISGSIATVLSGLYKQTKEYDEVDIELAYTDIPEGTTVEVTCSNAKFSIGKQSISGTSLTGKEVHNAGKLDMSIVLSLTVNDVSTLKDTSLVAIKLQLVEASKSGPVKKTLLSQALLGFN